MTSISKLHEESNELQKVAVEDMGHFPNAVSGKSCNGSESLEPWVFWNSSLSSPSQIERSDRRGTYLVFLRDWFSR